MCAAGNDNLNNDNDSKNIIIKDTKLYVPVVTLSAKNNQTQSKRITKGFERSLYWNQYKTKRENKNITNEYKYFLESNFVGVSGLLVLVYLNKQWCKTNDLKLDGITYQKT